MNPLDWNGLNFLWLYTLALLAAIGAAIALRWWFRRPNDELSRGINDLDSYEIAYLTGGKYLAVSAAIVSLVRRGLLTASPENRWIVARDSTPRDAHPLECRVHGAVQPGLGSDIRDVYRTTATVFADLHLDRRLTDFGLVVTRHCEIFGRLLPTLLVMSVACLGVIKICIGLARQRPVAFLVIGCVVSIVVALVGFARPLFRTRRGDKVLKEIKDANFPLQVTALTRTENLAADEIAWAIGLFGVGVLATGPLAKLRESLWGRRSTEEGSWIHSNNSSFDIGRGGGCGGGGCGGGGGGGGGCGGCGGGG